MSNLFSELNSLWSAKAGVRARQTRRARMMAAFHVLRDINFSAPWEDEPLSRCTKC